MKAIKITMYICSSLMIVAAIAGTIDYNAAQKTGSIQNLYKEEKPVVTNTRKEIDVEDYSRGEINRDEGPPAPKKNEKKMKKAVTANETYEEEIIALKTEEVKVEPILEPKKKKKLSYRSYSRGPIREEREDEITVTANAIDSTEKKAWDY